MALFTHGGDNLPDTKHRKKRSGKLGGISYGILLLWALINLFPVYWMFTFSRKNSEEMFGENVADLPQHWIWSNYTTALHTGQMGRYFINSVIVAVATIVITLIVALMATYAMSRLVWRGRKMMNKFFMLGLTIPIHASIVPIYVTLSRLHMLNTYWALIVQGLSGQYLTEWGPIGAALVMATFPTLFVYIFLSKRIQESFIAGAIKG